MSNAEIGLSDLVLGLLSEPAGLGARRSSSRACPWDAVRQVASATLPPPVDDVSALVPCDAHARKALELTFREALRLGHNYIGTEHVLLALLEVEDGTGVLAGLGVDKARAEPTITAALAARAAAAEEG